MTSTLTPPSLATRLDPDPASVRPWWAVAGWLAGLLGFVVFAATSAGLTVPVDAMADNAAVAREIAGAHAWVWFFQTSTFLLAVLVTVFGLGLRRRLAGQAPSGTLLPDAAGIGMALVAAMNLVGGGIGTEMFHTVRNIDDVDPDTVAAQLMLFNTMGWVWAGGILTTGAVAVAGLRHRSVSRGLGRFAAVMTVLIGLTQAVPLQYLAVAPVALFLVVAGISLQREASRDGSIVRATNATTTTGTGDGRYLLD